MTTRYAFALILLLAVGCDSTGVTEPPARGRFDGSVSGARDLVLGGQALFRIDPEFDSWGLLLIDGPGRVVSASVFRDAPTVGAVRIPDTAFAMLSAFSGTDGASFEATTGSLNVAEASNDLVRGTLVFEGESVGGDRVTVEVAFAATELAVPTAR